MRPWHLSAVRWQNERVPHLPQGHRASDPALLERWTGSTHPQTCISATMYARLCVLLHESSVFCHLFLFCLKSNIFRLNICLEGLLSALLDYVHRNEEETCFYSLDMQASTFLMCCRERFTTTKRRLSESANLSSFIMPVYNAYMSWSIKQLCLQYQCRSGCNMVKV